MGDNTKQTRPKRIFVSYVDRYSSKHIAEFLSTCVAGETSEDEETPAFSEGEPAFEIVGTVSSSSEDKNSFLLEQYETLLSKATYRELEQGVWLKDTPGRGGAETLSRLLSDS